MDQRTNVLICLGAATAANCIPCFEHYLKQAEASNITHEEVQEVVELASKVKNGAQIAMRTHIGKILGNKEAPGQPSCNQSRRSCCDPE